LLSTIWFGFGWTVGLRTTLHLVRFQEWASGQNLSCFVRLRAAAPAWILPHPQRTSALRDVIIQQTQGVTGDRSLLPGPGRGHQAMPIEGDDQVPLARLCRVALGFGTGPASSWAVGRPCPRRGTGAITISAAICIVRNGRPGLSPPAMDRRTRV
jgi:hypothetical protein